jgi:hypothetical protein
VLFEASTTSGSNVPEGNERVVCSGLFFFSKKKEFLTSVCVKKQRNAFKKQQKLFLKIINSI